MSALLKEQTPLTHGERREFAAREAAVNLASVCNCLNDEIKHDGITEQARLYLSMAEEAVAKLKGLIG